MFGKQKDLRPGHKREERVQLDGKYQSVYFVLIQKEEEETYLCCDKSFLSLCFLFSNFSIFLVPSTMLTSGGEAGFSSASSSTTKRNRMMSVRRTLGGFKTCASECVKANDSNNNISVVTSRAKIKKKKKFRFEIGTSSPILVQLALATILIGKSKIGLSLEAQIQKEILEI